MSHSTPPQGTTCESQPLPPNALKYVASLNSSTPARRQMLAAGASLERSNREQDGRVRRQSVHGTRNSKPRTAAVTGKGGDSEDIALLSFATLLQSIRLT